MAYTADAAPAGRGWVAQGWEGIPWPLLLLGPEPGADEEVRAITPRVRYRLTTLWTICMQTMHCRARACVDDRLRELGNEWVGHKMSIIAPKNCCCCFGGDSFVLLSWGDGGYQVTFSHVLSGRENKRQGSGIIIISDSDCALVLRTMNDCIEEQRNNKYSRA